MSGEFAGIAERAEHAELLLAVGLGLLAVQQLQLQVVGIAELHAIIQRVGFAHPPLEVFMA